MPQYHRRESDAYHFQQASQCSAPSRWKKFVSARLCTGLFLTRLFLKIQYVLSSIQKHVNASMVVPQEPVHLQRTACPTIARYCRRKHRRNWRIANRRHDQQPYAQPRVHWHAISQHHRSRGQRRGQSRRRARTVAGLAAGGQFPQGTSQAYGPGQIFTPFDSP